MLSPLAASCLFLVKSALDEQGQVVGKGNIEIQTDQVMKNIQKILSVENATFADIVKIKVNLVNLEDRQRSAPCPKEIFSRKFACKHSCYCQESVDKTFLLKWKLSLT